MLKKLLGWAVVLSSIALILAVIYVLLADNDVDASEMHRRPDTSPTIENRITVKAGAGSHSSATGGSAKAYGGEGGTGYGGEGGQGGAGGSGGNSTAGAHTGDNSINIEGDRVNTPRQAPATALAIGECETGVAISTPFGSVIFGGGTESCDRTRAYNRLKDSGEDAVARQVALDDPIAQKALAKLHRQGGPTDTSVGNNPPVGPGLIARIPARQTTECLAIANKQGEQSPLYMQRCGDGVFVVGSSDTANTRPITLTSLMPVEPAKTAADFLRETVEWDTPPTATSSEVSGTTNCAEGFEAYC
jgi:hypothetical protein